MAIANLHLNIPITEFLKFLDGQFVKGYGDSGKKAMDMVFQHLHDTFRNQLQQVRASRYPDIDGKSIIE